MIRMNDCFISIDPGREKTGIAVFSFNGEIYWHGIVSSEKLLDKINQLIDNFFIKLLVIGSGTSSKQKQRLLKENFPLLDFTVVDEYRTTDEARKLYFKDNPPRGWKKLIPLGMQTPPVPVDDYAAIAIGKKYLKMHNDI